MLRKYETKTYKKMLYLYLQPLSTEQKPTKNLNIFHGNILIVVALFDFEKLIFKRPKRKKHYRSIAYS